MTFQSSAVSRSDKLGIGGRTERHQTALHCRQPTTTVPQHRLQPAPEAFFEPRIRSAHLTGRLRARRYYSTAPSIEPPAHSFPVESAARSALVEIREERPEDIAAIRDVNNGAFGRQQEGNIVDALRSNGAVLLSLVATLNGHVIGHILYSPASVGAVTGAALGPMGVLPERQRQGIGSKLVEAGNRTFKDTGCPFIIVLGHVSFYPRFGFRPASTYGSRCEWDVPDDVFMLLVLDDQRMQGVSGLAKYRDEFSSAG